MAEVLLIVELEGAAQAQDAIASLNTRLSDLADDANRSVADHKRLTSVFSALSLLRTPLAIPAALAGAVVGLVTLADDYQLLGNRLKLVTGESGDLVDAEQRLLDLSQLTGTSLETNLTLFTRLAQNAETIGLSGEQIFQVTANLNQLVVISGASAEEANAALIQLAQGFASGELRGEELRSVMEQLPAVARTIADQLGLTIGQFREMSFAGKITAGDVALAILAATSEIGGRFDAMGDTAGQSFQRTKNAIFVLAGTLGDVTGIMDGLAAVLNGLSGYIEGAAKFIERLDSLDDLGFAQIGKALLLVGEKIVGFIHTTVLDLLSGRIEALAEMFDFFGGRWIGDRLQLIADVVAAKSGQIQKGLEGQSILDALIPPDAAEQEKAEGDAETAGVEAQAEIQREAAERIAARRIEIEAELAALHEASLEKARKEAEKIAKEARDLEADRLAFMVEVSAASLEEIRALWRARLEQADAGTRERLEAMKEISDLNEQIAEREIALVVENTALSTEQQHAHLLKVRESLEEQAESVESGAERFALGIAATNEALRELRKELDSNQGEVLQLTTRFVDTFTTVPGTVIEIVGSVRGSMRGFLTDVFTRTKSFGESLKDMFSNIGQSILSSLARLLADELLKSLLGLGGGGFLGGIADILGFEGGEGGGLLGGLFGGGEGSGFSLSNLGKLFQGQGAAAIGSAGVGAIFGMLFGDEPLFSLGQGIGSMLGGAIFGPIGSFLGGMIGKKLLGPLLENIFGGDPRAPIKVGEDSRWQIRGIVSYRFVGAHTGSFASESDYGSGFYRGAMALVRGAWDILIERGHDAQDIPAFSAAYRVHENRDIELASQVRQPELLYRIGLTGDFDIVQSGNYEDRLGTTFGAGHKIVLERQLGPTQATIAFVADQLEAIIPSRMAMRATARERGVQLEGVTARTSYTVNERGQGERNQWDGPWAPNAVGVHLTANMILSAMFERGFTRNQIAPFTVAYFASENLEQASLIGRLLFRLGGPIGAWSPFNLAPELVAFAVARLSAIGPVVRAAVGASRVVTHPTAFLAGEAGRELAMVRPLSSVPDERVIHINEPVMIGNDIDLRRYAAHLADALEAA